MRLESDRLQLNQTQKLDDIHEMLFQLQLQMLSKKQNPTEQPVQMIDIEAIERQLSAFSLAQGDIENNRRYSGVCASTAGQLVMLVLLKRTRKPSTGYSKNTVLVTISSLSGLGMAAASSGYLGNRVPVNQHS
jgi:hypothetical protein